ncbi:tRNA (adenosine(37)-N6)-threonylcarbamoyltransferase complex transferase subunit TsaD [Candidatus Aerophobetes bacterium]|uniref:tRNA N6-adenosine threonylcarbamoyltransferase n=1 Tax=Aerophobetes bacterium TaxID=2030807 RepID=A0A2A4WYH4_UNCAE|nr:MAG: tRNA (adenosine(37)-N6)-threonylcarbamoyltransferase complex transferase subunit TsaD [Candidatus Aerophobetes bacterium]
MRILGIETTCDETAIAIVEDGHTILTNLIASQIDIHQAFGGVFPEIASREHVSQLLPLIDQALKNTSLTKDSIDAIAVASSPGLMGSIITGLTVAKTLCLAWNKPLYLINHIHAHLISPMMGLSPEKFKNLFPALGIVVSGGHTFFAQVDSPASYTPICHSVDDAIGEAFDKVGTMLGQKYPGGPKVEKLAEMGDDTRFRFKAGHVKKLPLHFSFSGLKTNVFYTVEALKKEKELTAQDICDLAACFQKTAFFDLIHKAKKLTSTQNFKSICVGGGVSANGYFYKHLTAAFKSQSLPVYFPEKSLTTDNGAMIAALAFFQSEFCKKA